MRAPATYRLRPLLTILALSLLLLSCLGGTANASGVLDPGFDPNPDGFVVQVAAGADGKVFIGGYFSNVGGQPRARLARLNSDGSLDSSFTPLIAGGAVSEVAIQPDGKVLIAGLFSSVDGQARNGFARLNTDGTLDTAFSPGLSPIGNPSAVAVQPDGKIIVGGSFINVNGQARQNLARLNGDGTLDNAFANSSPDGRVDSIAVQADNKIVMSGVFTTVGGQPRSRLARLNTDGTLDESFTSPNPNGDVYPVALQGDGKLLIGGNFGNVGGQSRSFVARLNVDGTLDESFADSGANGGVSSIAVQPDGKVLIGGGFSQVGGQTQVGLARLQTSGALDTSLRNPSITDEDGGEVMSVALQADGKILAGGFFTQADGSPRNYVARFFPVSEPAPSPSPQPTPQPSPQPTPQPTPQPSPSPAPTPAPPGPGIPKAKLATKGKTVKATVSPLPGVTYAISASQAKKAAAKTIKGKCKANKKTKKVDCSIKLTKGSWAVSVTPKQDGVTGTPLTKSVRIK